MLLQAKIACARGCRQSVSIGLDLGMSTCKNSLWRIPVRSTEKREIDATLHVSGQSGQASRSHPRTLVWAPRESYRRSVCALWPGFQCLQAGSHRGWRLLGSRYALPCAWAVYGRLRDGRRVTQWLLSLLRLVSCCYFSPELRDRNDDAPSTGAQLHKGIAILINCHQSAFASAMLPRGHLAIVAHAKR